MIERLAETTQTLYAELLDQCRAPDSDTPQGSYVAKTINGATYWYRQQSFGQGRKTQTYVGRETPELLAQIERDRDGRSDEQRRRQLVDMVVAGGMLREQPTVAQVVRTIANAGMFRHGGVLVGTLAFGCYANMLGVRFEHGSLRTADVDVAQSPTIAVAQRTVDLPEELRKIEPRFFAVPGLDPREPSTSMKVRGRDLRIDFVTTARRANTAPVPFPRFGIAASPLRGIDYLIGETTHAIVLGGSGILVTVPSPGRFALHKLWLASERGVAERAKAAKDIRQAEQLIEVLESDLPDELRRAWDALDAHRGMRRVIAPSWRPG